MKKIIVLVITVFAINLSFAQRGQQVDQGNYSLFFEQTIKPEIEKQQKEFFAVLTKQEKEEVKSLSLKADKIFTLTENNRTPENRSEVRDEMMNLRDKAEIIAKAHPEQSEKYRKSMMENINKWRADMPNRNYSTNQNNGQGRGNGNGQGNVQGKTNNKGQGNVQGRGNNQRQSNDMGQANRGGQNMTGQFGGMQMFQQITDPAWLLLWSADRKPLMLMQQAGARGGMGMRNPIIYNKELREELKTYAQKNILPQITESRMLFNKKLNAEEKAQLTQAIGMINTRDAMQKSYMESDDFDPGSRRNDPNFEAFRESMQKSMQAVRMISIKHADEITEIKNSLKPQYNQWLVDIEKMFSKYDNDKFTAGEMLSRAFQQNTSPMAFVLFDTKNPEFWMTNRLQGNAMMGNNMQGKRNNY